MTTRRAQFIRELTIRGRAERTTHAYVASLAALAVVLPAVPVPCRWARA